MQKSLELGPRPDPKEKLADMVKSKLGDVVEAVKGKKNDMKKKFGEMVKNVKDKMSSDSSDNDMFDRDLVAEPPRTSKDAVFDLDLDLSGVWVRAGMYQYIWHECMEVTISGNNAPLHHMIHDGKYITYDDTETSTTEAEGTFQYKAIIAKPTKKEADLGSKATLVFFIERGMPDIVQKDGTISRYDHDAEVAIRFLDSEGRLMTQQNVSGGLPLVSQTKEENMPCKYPWTNSGSGSHCSAKKDIDEWNSFTPACCGDGYGGSTEGYFNGNPAQANEAWRPYVASCADEA